MSQETSLRDLILGYYKQVGGLVEPPAYGIYEILLPDEVAARWGVSAHQRLIFAGERDAPGGELETAQAAGVILLHYGHPMVETVVTELRCQSANGRFFINHVRPEKPGMFALIEKALSLPNARLFPLPNAVERPRLYHYVCFNFKVSLIADEKRELLLPIWMHLQSGYPVKADEIERLAILETENQFGHLELAGLAWLPTAGTDPLAEQGLRALLTRARQAVPGALGDTLPGLGKRLQRYLELDRTRLQQYYDNLQKDTEKRLQKADEDRHPALEAKIAAIRSERQAKLADVEQKYHLRLELELVNLAIISQPKVELVVEIKKRTAATKRSVVWDPLRHVLELPACEVCGLPGEELYLCENGHLAHGTCLAPQCVQCKRTFCQKCAQNVLICVVCDRPICVHSLTRCPQCNRVTCSEHINLCHAANGEPQRLPAVLPQASSPAASTALAVVSTPVPSSAETMVRRKSSSQKPVSPKPKASAEKKAPPGPKVDRLEVYTETDRPLVSAYVMTKKREIAVRSWELTDYGIAVRCQCEDFFCRKNNVVYRPDIEGQIEQQVMFYIHELMREYHVPADRLRFYRIRYGEPFEARRLSLTGKWKDPAALEQARQGFEKLT